MAQRHIVNQALLPRVRITKLHVLCIGRAGLRLDNNSHKWASSLRDSLYYEELTIQVVQSKSITV